LISRDGTDDAVEAWDVESDAEHIAFLAERSAANCVAYSPDGRWIVGGSAGGTLHLWDAESGDMLATYRVGSAISSVAYSPDGKRIGVGTASGVCTWGGEDGIGLDRLRGQKTCVNSVAYSPDGRRIASGSADGTLQLWDTGSGAMLAVFRGHSDSVTSITYSPDGRRIVSGSNDGSIRIWDAEIAPDAAVLRGEEGSITSIAYSPDGRRIAIANSWSLRSYTARVFDAESGAEVAVLAAYGDAIRSIEFSPDGRRIFGGSEEGRVHVWDAHTGQRLEVVESGSDVKSIGTVAAKVGLRAIASAHETVIVQTEDGKPVAWFPIALGHIVSHPSGRAWAGAVANHLYIISLEGICPSS